jgi:hypothetical protein
LIRDLIAPGPAPAAAAGTTTGGGTFSTSPSKDEARNDSALDGLSVLRRRPPAPPAPPPAPAAAVGADQRGVPGVVGMCASLLLPLLCSMS